MHEFDRLVGEWHGEGELPIDPPMSIRSDATIEHLGEFLVFRSVAHPAEVPDTLSIIGGAPEGEPQPMHYFDSRGVKRRYLTTVEGSTWTIWRAPGEDWNGPDGPGFDQRFVAELSADGDTIDGRWERGTGDADDGWEIDFPITYVRRSGVRPAGELSETAREPARDPQDLERFLVARQHAGDVDGMVELFEADAVVDVGGGRLIRGAGDIRAYFEELMAEGRRFQVGVQQPAVVNGDLALTSTRSPGGTVTGEVARRQPDGTWRWVVDRYEIA